MKTKPSELFATYITPGKILDYPGWFRMSIDTVDPHHISAEGTVLFTNDYPCWFHVGEKVHLMHISDEVWRLTSDLDDHGQAVFLGEDYNGVGIGS